MTYNVDLTLGNLSEEINIFAGRNELPTNIIVVWWAEGAFGALETLDIWGYHLGNPTKITAGLWVQKDGLGPTVTREDISAGAKGCWKIVPEISDALVTDICHVTVTTW